MLLKMGMVLAAVPLSLLALVAGTGVVVVDVHEEGHHLGVPVPLVLAEVAATLVPEGKGRVDIGEARRYLPVAEEMVKALGESPDGELVRVEEPGQKVLIAKVGPNLLVTVSNKGDGQDVAVTVPLAMASTLLREASGGSLTPRELVAALRGARLTTLADVRQGDQHVRVTVW